MIIILALTSIISITLSSSEKICVFSDHNYANSNELNVNGQYTSNGIYNNLTYYVSDCNSYYIYFDSNKYEWKIGTKLNSYFLSCNAIITEEEDLELSQCNNGGWSTSQNITITNGECPITKCEVLNVQNANSQNTNANYYQIDDNVFEHENENIYLIFNFHKFSWFLLQKNTFYNNQCDFDENAVITQSIYTQNAPHFNHENDSEIIQFDNGNTATLVCFGYDANMTSDDWDGILWANSSQLNVTDYYNETSITITPVYAVPTVMIEDNNNKNENGKYSQFMFGFTFFECIVILSVVSCLVLIIMIAAMVYWNKVYPNDGISGKTKSNTNGGGGGDTTPSHAKMKSVIQHSYVDVFDPKVRRIEINKTMIFRNLNHINVRTNASLFSTNSSDVQSNISPKSRGDCDDGSSDDNAGENGSSCPPSPPPMPKKGKSLPPGPLYEDQLKFVLNTPQ